MGNAVSLCVKSAVRALDVMFAHDALTKFFTCTLAVMYRGKDDAEAAGWADVRYS